MMDQRTSIFLIFLIWFGAVYAWHRLDNLVSAFFIKSRRQPQPRQLSQH